MSFLYQIEKGGSGKCMGCKKEFQDNEYKFGSCSVYDAKGKQYGSTFYRHFECADRNQIVALKAAKTPYADASIRGWSKLDKETQEQARTALDSIVDAEAEKSPKKKKNVSKGKGKPKKSPKKTGTKRKKNEADEDTTESTSTDAADDDADGKKKNKKKKKEGTKSSKETPNGILSVYE